MNSFVRKIVTIDFHLILLIENEVDAIIDGLDRWKNTLTKSFFNLKDYLKIEVCLGKSIR